MCVNQTGVGQKFAPPKKAPEKETCIDTHENASADIVPPCPPISMLWKTCVWWCELLSGKCPRPLLSKNQATLKLGEGGETIEEKQKIWIERWCELSSDTSSKKSACHRHEATAKANNGCQWHDGAGNRMSACHMDWRLCLPCAPSVRHTVKRNPHRGLKCM